MAGEIVRFVLCIRNEDYQASLETRKIYREIADPKAEALGKLRLVDDTGEDYLFPCTDISGSCGSDRAGAVIEHQRELLPGGGPTTG
jgi:hypothetical protein